MEPNNVHTVYKVLLFLAERASILRGEVVCPQSESKLIKPTQVPVQLTTLAGVGIAS